MTSSVDESELAADLIYADAVQRVEAELDFDAWQSWTSHLLAPTL